ncbi:hypothetical protein R4Z10_07500 [Niallia sp. XMNu-256]|uniref:hypothetical protein n=1 Tax=Niallia sp. XMNu-256 TaxID=3082444 RepID=UPI0030D19CA4
MRSDSDYGVVISVSLQVTLKLSRMSISKTKVRVWRIVRMPVLGLKLNSGPVQALQLTSVVTPPLLTSIRKTAHTVTLLTLFKQGNVITPFLFYSDILCKMRFVAPATDPIR